MDPSFTGMEPTTRKFLETINAAGGPPLYTLSVKDARGVLTGLQAMDVAKAPADVEDRTIPGGPNKDVSVRIVRPRGATDVLPAVIYCHGGGWILGDKETHDRLVRELADKSEAAIVFVNYTPSPEAQYPTALEEAYAVAKYVAENGASLGLDPSRLAVAGDSVGGNMAAALALLAKERGGPKIVYQALFYPVTDADFDTPSYKRFAEGYFLTREAMKWFWNAYLPDEAARRQPTVSPLRASLDQLKGLPPALVINGEFDVLRDEGEAYAHKLNDAGVRVTAVRFHGTMHDFMMLNPIAGTPATRGAVELAAGALRAALAK